LLARRHRPEIQEGPNRHSRHRRRLCECFKPVSVHAFAHPVQVGIACAIVYCSRRWPVPQVTEIEHEDRTIQYANELEQPEDVEKAPIESGVAVKSV
jgi:hypothetical protein